MYATGRGVLKDEAEAVRWYRLAADQGDADAQLNLGVMYDNGRGVLKDEAEAVRWYRLAADQGDAAAQFNLGNMYAKGGASSRTRPKRCAGTVWPPTRGMPLRSSISGTGTTTGGASSRIPCLRTCGPTSLAQTGTQAPGSCGTILNVT